MLIILLLLPFLCNSFNINTPSYITSKLVMLNDNLDSISKPSVIINENLNMPFGNEWTYSDLIHNIHDHNVVGATLYEKNHILVAIDNHLSNGVDNFNLHAVKIIPESYNYIIKLISDNNINFDFSVIPTNFLSNIFQTVSGPIGNVFIYFFIFTIISNIVRSSGGSMNPTNIIENQMLGVKKDDQLIDRTKINTTFADVAGCDEAKFELTEVVDFLKNPELYTDAGAKIPTGVLLEGPPGTGKTLLARAVAGEADVSFITASASEFIEMFVGVGASRVRKLFDLGRSNSPCVIFIDEIDAIGRQRGAGVAGGNDEREQTLNQILTNMDGFNQNDGIIVLAATNRADVLDNALTRPGRFDRKVQVTLPDTEGRIAILKVHSKGKKFHNTVDFNEIATLTSGFSGADLANLLNEAAILSVRDKNYFISRTNVLDAYEKITIGLPSMNKETNHDIIELVSNHEIGHTLTAALFPEFFNIRKVTINSNRGGAGGYTLFTPLEQYQKYASKKFLLANLIIALGGRAAEIYLFRKKNNLSTKDNLIFKGFDDLDITTGASNDLLQATKIAKDYITKYGFGNLYGHYESMSNDLPFMGRELSSPSKSPSENTKNSIDIEVNNLLNFALNKALELININENSFIEMVELIKEKKELSAYEINEIITRNDNNPFVHELS